MSNPKTVEEILTDLQAMANPEYIKKMEYFGINGDQALGIMNADLKPYAKTVDRSQVLAEALWQQPIHEAKHLSILLTEPKKLTEETAEKWVAQLYSWDICDGLGMKVFPKTSFGMKKALEWTTRHPEFEKRAGFATMVGNTLNRKIPDSSIESFFPIIMREAWDERNFVKKAVNWALRQAGKRSLYLNKKAIECAEGIKSQDTKSARWIANGALRELRSDVIQERLEKKEQKKRAD